MRAAGGGGGGTAYLHVGQQGMTLHVCNVQSGTAGP